MSDDIETYEHFRVTDANGDSIPAGVYRVVGTDESDTEGRVTLLRVADADGQRRHTGDLRTVPREQVAAFESVPNPDGDRAASDSVAAGLGDLYWQLRSFVEQLAANPLATVVALAVTLVGLFGDPVVPLPGTLLGVVGVAGALGLSYVGSGRL